MRIRNNSSASLLQRLWLRTCPHRPWPSPVRPATWKHGTKGENCFRPPQPLQDRCSDSGSSIRRTSTHGTIQTGSPGLDYHGQPSSTGGPQDRSSRPARPERSSTTPTGLPQASPSGSARREQQSTTRSPQASPSLPAHQAPSHLPARHRLAPRDQLNGDDSRRTLA